MLTCLHVHVATQVMALEPLNEAVVREAVELLPLAWSQGADAGRTIQMSTVVTSVLYS